MIIHVSVECLHIHTVFLTVVRGYKETGSLDQPIAKRIIIIINRITSQTSKMSISSICGR